MQMQAQIGVVFDCDGTLLDSMDSWYELEAELARRGGFPLLQEDSDIITTLTIGETGDYYHNKYGLGTSGEDVVRMMGEFMMEYYSTRACPRPGALEFVQQLYEAGVPMGVASSTPRNQLLAGIEHAGFMPYMQAVYSVDDVGKSKREPAVYDAARDHLGTTRAQTWGVEDAVYAVRTLKNAGYHALGIYDSDIAGTYDQLQAEADIAVLSFESLTGDEFLSIALS